MERADELKERIRQQPLNDRLEESRRRIGDMCSKGRCPKMTIPVQHDDDDFYINTTLADAQATIAALQVRVKELEESRDAWKASQECSEKAYMALVNQIPAERFDYDPVNVALLDGAKEQEIIGRKQIADLQAELERVRGERDEDNKIGLPVIVELLRQADKGQDGPLSVLKGIIAERDTLQADHARVLGLVQAAVVRIEQVEGDLHVALNGTRHDPSWIRPIQLSRNERQELYLGCESQLKAIRQSLPAQPAQGGA